MEQRGKVRAKDAGGTEYGSPAPAEKETEVAFALGTEKALVSLWSRDPKISWGEGEVSLEVFCGLGSSQDT